MSEPVSRTVLELGRRVVRTPSASAGPVACAPGSDRLAAGFTMIELLVVIAVIGLLIAALVGIGSTVVYNQKVRNTQAVMRNLTLAIDQFKEEDPLRLIYNGRNPSFGPFPPYQLANAPDTGNQNSLVYNLEANPPGGAANSVASRFGRDFVNNVNPPLDLVTIDPSNQQRTNDDARALYTYLKVLMPSALTQVPESALKPLNPQYPAPGEFVNPSGHADNTEAQVRVLGIHDAWGVPLDYLLYVKLEWGLRVNPNTGVEEPGVKIVDRIPVLRSRGIKREVYDVQRRALEDGQEIVVEPAKWIFSAEFPSPRANVAWDTGIYQASDSSGNGWARAVGLAEDYGYVPDMDRDGQPP